MPFSDFALKHCPVIHRSPKPPKPPTPVLEDGTRIYWCWYAESNTRHYGVYTTERAVQHDCFIGLWDEEGRGPCGIQFAYLMDETPLREALNDLR